MMEQNFIRDKARQIVDGPLRGTTANQAVAIVAEIVVAIYLNNPDRQDIVDALHLCPTGTFIGSVHLIIEEKKHSIIMEEGQ